MKKKSFYLLIRNKKYTYDKKLYKKNIKETISSELLLVITNVFVQNISKSPFFFNILHTYEGKTRILVSITFYNKGSFHIRLNNLLHFGLYAVFTIKINFNFVQILFGTKIFSCVFFYRCRYICEIIEMKLFGLRNDVNLI